MKCPKCGSGKIELDEYLERATKIFVVECQNCWHQEEFNRINELKKAWG